MAIQSKKEIGKIDLNKLKNLMNKIAGANVTEAAPVKEWISLGSVVLDSMICRGKVAGLPVGKIIELAGEESTGKSYFAIQAARMAQLMGMLVIYLDAESALDPEFVQRAGVDMDNNFIYIQTTSVEKTLEQIEAILDSVGTEHKILFIWDSLAATPVESDASDFDPNSTVGVKARIMSKALAKLAIPLYRNQATLLILNQLKTYIPQKGEHPLAVEKYVTPAGKSMDYFASLRIWLTKKKGSKHHAEDDEGNRIGSHVKVQLKKSRYGTENRTCELQLMWSDQVYVREIHTILDIIRRSEYYSGGGAGWFTISSSSDKKYKLQGLSNFENLYNDDLEFRNLILDILREELIVKFEKRLGSHHDNDNITSEEKENIEEVE